MEYIGEGIATAGIWASVGFMTTILGPEIFLVLVFAVFATGIIWSE
ncbi:MAG: hypothetical protein WDA09_02235 [Bacteriovoracaceae bacterium]